MAKFQSTERFVQSHNLILGDLPEQLTLEKVCEKVKFEKEKIEKFGLFGGSANDYNKYYPDIKLEDLKPRAEDYAFPIYRALSETRVRPYFPVNFEQNGILRESRKKLIGQSVYANHDAEVGNSLGSVYETEWQESQTIDGFVVPAGINSVLKLDSKRNPNIVRGVMADPPDVHSTSVTVQFEWEQSHPELTRDEFYAQVGRLDAKGKLVERYATKIIAYHEISLVSHGADPYAQQIKDGKIINPEFADTQSFSKEAGYKRYHFFNFKDLGTESLIDQEEAIPEPLKIEETQLNPMKEELKKLLMSFGVDPATVESDSFKADSIIDANKLKDTQITTLTSEVDVLKSDKATLEAEKLELTSRGNEALAEVQNEAIRLYKLSTETPEPSMLELMAKSDLKGAKAFIDTFGKLAEDNFHGNCQDCGSDNVSRMSSKKDENPETVKGTPTKPKSDEELMAEYRAEASKPNTVHLHGVTKK